MRHAERDPLFFAGRLIVEHDALQRINGGAGKIQRMLSELRILEPLVRSPFELREFASSCDAIQWHHLLSFSEDADFNYITYV